MLNSESEHVMMAYLEVDDDDALSIGTLIKLNRFPTSQLIVTMTLKRNSCSLDPPLARFQGDQILKPNAALIRKSSDNSNLNYET
jgi:hypothetical protein